MSCANCTQAIEEANEQNRKIQEQALALAKETGEWVAIYRDPETGVDRFILQSQAAGFPVKRIITPQMQNTSL